MGQTYVDEDASLDDGALALEEACSLLCETLGLLQGEALLLLVEFDWDRKAAVEAFLADPKGSRHAAGIQPKGTQLFLPEGEELPRYSWKTVTVSTPSRT